MPSTPTYLIKTLLTPPSVSAEVKKLANISYCIVLGTKTNDLKCSTHRRRLDLEVLDVECIWIELTLPKNKRILVGLFYRPPNSISELK